VKVEADIHADALRRFDAGDHLVEHLGRADPVHLGSGVHLHRREALIEAGLCGAGDVVGRSPPIQA
jgi:hypothetical protein